MVSYFTCQSLRQSRKSLLKNTAKIQEGTHHCCQPDLTGRVFGLEEVDGECRKFRNQATLFARLDYDRGDE